jgi:hypothetical protein
MEKAVKMAEMSSEGRVTSQDFIKFWGKFFAFVLHMLIEKP